MVLSRHHGTPPQTQCLVPLGGKAGGFAGASARAACHERQNVPFDVKDAARVREAEVARSGAVDTFHFESVGGDAQQFCRLIVRKAAIAKRVTEQFRKLFCAYIIWFH